MQLLQPFLSKIKLNKLHTAKTIIPQFIKISHTS